MKIDLGGTWTLCGHSADGKHATGLLNCRVPGNIEAALFEAGLVKDPYIEINAMELRKYEFFDWTFERRFEYAGRAGEPLRLICEGLDCIAEIYCNGKLAGKSENALITHAFDLTQFVVPGVNSLKVEIKSANNHFRQYGFEAMTASCYPYNFEATRIRKPAHAWGWDITPRMALGGIFRPIRIETVPEHRFLDTFLQLSRFHADTDPGDPGVTLMFHYHLATINPDFDGMELELTGYCGKKRFSHRVKIWSASGATLFPVADPVLWWPRGYGKPVVYRVEAKLLKHGEFLAATEFDFGIRKLELEAAELAESDCAEPDFRFIVNNVPVRIHGCNHVPADALHANDAERLPKIIELALELNCNMLRVWGGGIYEDELFYQLCDHHGILVWQDFMLGCMVYPQDQAFLETMRIEAESAIRRLRQHPSLALWSGDNECDMVPLWGGVSFDPNRNRITREVLPQAVLRHDPGRPYLASSPWCSPKAWQKSLETKLPPGTLTPEQHLWGVRDYFKSDFYRNTNASFVSEIGYHGAPAAESIRKFTGEAKAWPPRGNEVWNYHASNPFLGSDDYLNYRIALMEDQIKEMFGFTPDNLDDFVLASQICQAEAKKYFIELFRSKRKMSGILWWNLIDCWPQFSDAVVDYYFEKKLAFNYIKRVQQDFVIILPAADAWMQRIVAVNDSQREAAGHYRVYDAESGGTLSEGDFAVGPGAIADLDRVKVCTTAQNLLLIEWTLSDGSRFANHAVSGYPQYDFTRYRDCWLPVITKSFTLD